MIKMAANVEIKIDKKGNVTFEVNGCTGTVCEDITKVLTAQLGDIESQQLKAEYSENPDRLDVFEGE